MTLESKEELKEEIPEAKRKFPEIKLSDIMQCALLTHVKDVNAEYYIGKGSHIQGKLYYMFDEYDNHGYTWKDFPYDKYADEMVRWLLSKYRHYVICINPYDILREVYNGNQWSGSLKKASDCAINELRVYSTDSLSVRTMGVASDVAATCQLMVCSREVLRDLFPSHMPVGAEAFNLSYKVDGLCLITTDDWEKCNLLLCNNTYWSAITTERDLERMWGLKTQLREDYERIFSKYTEDTLSALYKTIRDAQDIDECFNKLVSAMVSLDEDLPSKLNIILEQST